MNWSWSTGVRKRKWRFVSTWVLIIVNILFKILWESNSDHFGIFYGYQRDKFDSSTLRHSAMNQQQKRMIRVLQSLVRRGRNKPVVELQTDSRFESSKPCRWLAKEMPTEISSLGEARIKNSCVFGFTLGLYSPGFIYNPSSNPNSIEVFFSLRRMNSSTISAGK